MEDPQVALRLLRHSAGFGRLVHSMRCVPPVPQQPALETFDQKFRGCFTAQSGLPLGLKALSRLKVASLLQGLASGRLPAMRLRPSWCPLVLAWIPPTLSVTWILHHHLTNPPLGCSLPCSSIAPLVGTTFAWRLPWLPNKRSCPRSWTLLLGMPSSPLLFQLRKRYFCLGLEPS